MPFILLETFDSMEVEAEFSKALSLVINSDPHSPIENKGSGFFFNYQGRRFELYVQIDFACECKQETKDGERQESE